MKVLITGGSGFLGINLVRYLFAKGIGDITCLDIADFDYPEKAQIKFIKGDIRSSDAVQDAIKGVDVIVHAAAALPLYEKEEIYSTEVDGTRKLLEVAYANNIGRFIHISSTAVYGIPKKHPIYEDDKMDGVGFYGEAKILAEGVCEEYRKKGMCVPVIRPKTFIGPERLGVFALLYDWAKDGRSFPMIGNGRNIYQLLDVEDLCASIYLCMMKDKNVVNDVFNIGAKEFTTIGEDFQSVLDEASFGKKIIFFPAKPAILLLKMLEFFKLSPLYKWVYETACQDSWVSIDKAETKLGFSPEYSTKDALLRNYRWYLNNLNNFQNAKGISHRVPWDQGALKLLKVFF